MKIVIAKDFVGHAEFIRQLPERIAEGEGELIYDGRNRVLRFRHQGLSLMVKCYKRANVVQQVAYTFFNKSKAERAFLYAGEFQRRGIDTPPAVAYMECRRFGLFFIGYFVSLEVAGTECSRLLRDVEQYPPQLAQAVADHIVLMHSRGVLHGDLNLTNFLCVKGDDGGYRFTMIDTNRSHFCDGMPADDICLNNLIRLTHRRDLYRDLVSRYASLRGWDVSETASKALDLLNRFEHRRWK